MAPTAGTDLFFESARDDDAPRDDDGVRKQPPTPMPNADDDGT
jgi:hypothetical protein